MRDGSLEIRKVKGEVNPADVFTKHLSSADRMTELLKLFGCHFVRGRPEGAPELRREDSAPPQSLLACELAYSLEHPVDQGGRSYPGVWFEGEYVADAYRHPEVCLPHQISGNLDDLFPRAEVVPELEEVREARDQLEERGKALGGEKDKVSD